MITGTVSTLVLDRKRADFEKIFESTFENFLKDIRKYFRTEIEAQFEAEGTPVWKELTPAYAKRKRQIVGEKQILQFSEKLKTGYVKGGIIQNKKLVFEFPTVYARRHQIGYEMPQRAINLNFVERIAVKRINAFARKSANTAGFKAKFYRQKTD